MERLYLGFAETAVILQLSPAALRARVRAGLPVRAYTSPRQTQFAVAVLRDLVSAERRPLLDAVADRRVGLSLATGSRAAAWFDDRVWPCRGATHVDDFKRDAAAWRVGRVAFRPQEVTTQLLRRGLRMVPHALKAKPAAYRVIVGARLRQPGEPPMRERNTLLDFERAVCDEDPFGLIQRMVLAGAAVVVPAAAAAAARTSVVKPFLDECCVMGAELCGITTELYSAYVAYCGDVEMPPVSQRRFAELLHQLGHPAAASALSTVPRAIRARAASRNGSDIRLGLAVRGTPYA